MLDCIEMLHNKHIIHRDLKPENFMVGIGADCNMVHVIDFGLSKVYRDKNNEHIPYRENKVNWNYENKPNFQIRSAPDRYRPLRLDQRASRRRAISSRRFGGADLCSALFHAWGASLAIVEGGESKGQIRESLESKLCKVIVEKELIKNVKLKTTLEELCLDLPAEFIDIVSYTRQLRFDEQPGYSYIRKRLTHLFQREGFVQDYDFDWKST